MERLFINELLKWKNSHRRKPLILEGARQVGKTWIVKEFAKRYYKDIAYINFEEKVFMRNLFETDFDIDRIVTYINAATKTNCTNEDTLIFLDEIQEAHNGLTALKYFCENAPQLHVIAAGSLLGIELHKHISFPVGKVQFLTLYPMTFIEFLMALGENGMAQMITNKNWEGLKLFSSKYKEYLKQYYFVGGMPEAVLSFSQYKDWEEVREIQKEILESYDKDFSKHAPDEITPRIKDLWNSIPSQLSKENRKFIYGLVKEGARAREYEIALEWLNDGGLIHKVNAVKAPRLPLKSYEDRSAFKIYALDVGLLGAMAGLDTDTVLNGNQIFTEFKGALTEQYVLQQLILHKDLFYYSKANSKQEIDFLTQANGNIIPIEVKAETNTKAKSLRQFITDNNSVFAYRISMNDYQQDEKITDIPLYGIEAI